MCRKKLPKSMSELRQRIIDGSSPRENNSLRDREKSSSLVRVNVNLRWKFLTCSLCASYFNLVSGIVLTPCVLFLQVLALFSTALAILKGVNLLSQRRPSQYLDIAILRKFSAEMATAATLVRTWFGHFRGLFFTL